MSDAESKKDATRKDAALEVTMPSDLAGSHALIEQLACTVDSQTDTIEQQIVAAAFHRHLLRVVHEFDAFIYGALQFNGARRYLIRASAVDDDNVFTTGQAFGHTTGIHGDVAAADHDHRIRELRAFAGIDPAQEADTVDHAFVIFTRDSHWLAPP